MLITFLVSTNLLTSNVFSAVQCRACNCYSGWKQTTYSGARELSTCCGARELSTCCGARELSSRRRHFGWSSDAERGMVWPQWLSVSTSIISVPDLPGLSLRSEVWLVYSPFVKFHVKKRSVGSYCTCLHSWSPQKARKLSDYMWVSQNSVDIKCSPLIGQLFAVPLLIELPNWLIRFTKLSSFAECDWWF